MIIQKKKGNTHFRFRHIQITGFHGLQGQRKESTHPPRTRFRQLRYTLQVSFTRSLRIDCLLENRHRQLLMVTEKCSLACFIPFLASMEFGRTYGFPIIIFLDTVLDSDNL
jgi:hypothetical protein